MRPRRFLLPVSVLTMLALTIVPPAPVLADGASRSAAFQLYQSGRYAEALPLLASRIEGHPRDVEALIKRGNCLVRLGKPSNALADFERVVRLSPMNPAAESDLGIALLMLGRHAEALRHFELAQRYWAIPLNAARGIRPGETDSIQAGKSTAHAGAAQAFHRLGRNEEALAEYGRALAILPGDSNAYVGRGDVLAALGRNEEALADLNEAVRLGPSNARAFSRRGILLADLGRDDEALADQGHAVQLDPTFGHAWRLRATIYSRRGQNDLALADLDRAVELQPDDAGTLKDRGGVLVRMAQHQRAIPDLDRALKLDPNRASAYLNRGAAYSGLGQYEHAIDDFDKAIALEPENAPAYTNRGLAYFMVGRYEQAVASLGEAVRLAPRNAVVHINRGNVYARLGFKDQAVVDYAAAERIDPRLLASLGGPAKLLDEMGRQTLAVRDQGDGLRANADEIALHLERGNALRARSDWPGAIEEFSRVIELDRSRAEAHVARGWARLCAGLPGAENDARAFLDLKGWRDRLSPYMALLGALGARRARNDVRAQTFLDEAVAQTAPGTWPLPLLRYLRHDLTTQALLDAATSDTQRTEAHAFAALELLARGDRKAARDHLEWVRDHGTRRSIAADLARATLDRIDQIPQVSQAEEKPRGLAIETLKD